MKKEKSTMYSISRKIGYTTLALSAGMLGIPLNASANEPLKVAVPNINPTVKEIQSLGDGFELTKSVNVVGKDQADADAYRELTTVLKNVGITVNKIKNDKDTTIMIGESDDNIPEMKKALTDMKVAGAKDLKEEGYVVASSDNTVLIEGKDGDGTYYGVKTLKQLLQKEDNDTVISEAYVKDEPDLKQRGIVEGFYGTPWSHEDRLDQFQFYGDQKLNFYIYAPKDDPYHRKEWRKPYPDAEKAKMKELIKEAKRNKVDFVFAISPGIDIRFDGKEGEEDIEALIKKSETMYEMGVRDFAIYFDDIVDRSGDKQANVLNKFKEKFIDKHKDVNPLITVPTEYFYSGMKREGTKSPYTKGFSETLHKDIEVMWTGHDVVSQGVTTEEAKNVYDIYNRKMSLFWNYPVTDYNIKKLALGPIYNLSQEIDRYVNMLAINPMEFSETSKISIYTGADYSWNLKAYDAEKSFKNAVNYLYGDNAEDFYYFANHTTRVDNGRMDAPEMQELVDQFFDKALRNQDVSVEAAKIRSELTKMKEVSKNLLSKLPSKELKETSKQLTVFAEDTEYAETALKMMEAILKGDVKEWWKLKQQSVEEIEKRKNANAKVSNVIDSLIKQANEKSYQLYDASIPKDKEEAIEYVGSASMPSVKYTQWWYNASPYEVSNFAIDNKDKAYMSEGNAVKDSYVQIDLQKEMPIHSIYLLQGRSEKDMLVEGQFSYSTDGINWKTLGKAVKDYENIVGDLNIHARYIRFNATENAKNQWFVRDFKVNKDISEESAYASIKNIKGTITRKLNQENGKTEPIIEANYQQKVNVKKGDTFVVDLRDYTYVSNIEADFGLKGSVEYTRNDIDWETFGNEQRAQHPIAKRIRFVAKENGKIEKGQIKIVKEARIAGEYQTNYKFMTSTPIDNINNFDIASNAVAGSTKAGQYLQLDLKEMTKVRDLKLVFNESYGGDRPTNVTFEYSVDGTKWIKLPYNVYSWYNEFTGLNFDARYIKFTVNEDREGVWTRIGEFSVNSSDVNPTFEATVPGQQPAHRLTFLNDNNVETSYSPVTNLKNGDTITYHFNQDRDIKRLHILQSKDQITNAQVIARTVDKEELVLGTLNEGYTILNVPNYVDIASVKIKFTKDFVAREIHPVEIYEITPEYYTVDETKELAKKLVKEAKELLNSNQLAIDAKETVALKTAIKEMESVIKKVQDRQSVNTQMKVLKAAMDAYVAATKITKPDVEMKPAPETGDTTNSGMLMAMFGLSVGTILIVKRSKETN